MPFTPCKSASPAHFERVRPPLKQGANANLKHVITMNEDKNEVSSESANVKPKRKRKPFKDFTNTRLGRLVVLKEAPFDKRGNMQWLCRCDCGTEKIVAGSSLMRGATKSCGCLNKEVAARKSTTHGLSRHPLHTTWLNIIQRCTNPSNKRFPQYGGRGITICESWRHDFARFLSDMGEKPSPLHTIERRNNNRGYSKDNCSWELPEVQANNKSNNRFIQFAGKKQTVTQWSREVGISRRTLILRIDHLGWDEERALTEPTKKRRSLSTPPPLRL